MESKTPKTDTPQPQRYYKPFLWMVSILGMVICVYCASRFPVAHLTDLRFLVLAFVTVGIGSRLNVKIPGVRSEVTVSDPLVFLTILMFGGEAGILLAAAESFCVSLRFTKKTALRLFNSGVMTCSYFLTVSALQLLFGPVTNLTSNAYSARLIVAICVMGFLQFAFNTTLVARCLAFRTAESFWPVWKNNFMYTSLTFFAGASAAGILVKVIGLIGFYAFLAATPVIAVIYFTYWTYLKKDEATKSQLEQARRHLEELNNHIAEQERISRALEEARNHFRHAALHDSLTGLPNRTLFTELLKAEIETSRRRPDYLFAVIFLDLDRFKNINDSLGHSHGDLLLVSLAQRLEVCLRQLDTLARFGGDEFAILLNGIKDHADAVRIAERIQQELTVPFTLDKNTAFTTASIGIAVGGSAYKRPEDILRDADTAMYRAKENGKARYEMFDQTMHATAVSRLKLESDLRQAIERREFRVFYQPIVALDTGMLAGFEALVRWPHPERGMISPAEFIPIAEETGLIVAIGLWVLEESCRQMRTWQRHFPASRAMTLSVNLSGKQVMQPDLTQQVLRILQRTDFEPRSLKLEITESVVMENAEAAAEVFKRLRALDVQLSIDDFGTGYSSLSYLHRFPVNYLKVDRSFVSRMCAGDENVEIVRTISMLAHNLGLEVIAEGIETAEQLTRLRALKCEYGQGYLFSPPVSAEAAAAIIENKAEWEAQATRFEELFPDKDVELISESYSM